MSSTPIIKLLGFYYSYLPIEEVHVAPPEEVESVHPVLMRADERVDSPVGTQVEASDHPRDIDPGRFSHVLGSDVDGFGAWYEERIKFLGSTFSPSSSSCSCCFICF